MKNFISVTHVTEMLFEERFHVRQLLTIYMLVMYQGTELESLKNVEQIIIAQRIVFEQIVVMPKGQQRKIEGAICNIFMHQSIVIKHVTYCLVPLKDLVLFF